MPLGALREIRRRISPKCLDKKAKTKGRPRRKASVPLARKVSSSELSDEENSEAHDKDSRDPDYQPDGVADHGNLKENRKTIVTGKFSSSEEGEEDSREDFQGERSHQGGMGPDAVFSELDGVLQDSLSHIGAVGGAIPRTRMERTSEDLYDTPEAVRGQIGTIHKDLAELMSLLGDPNWKDKFKDSYSKVVNATDTLQRYVVLNNMTAEFQGTLLNIMDQANQVKVTLKSPSDEVGRIRSASLTSERRTFSSSFARNLEQNHTPHFQAIFSEQGSEDNPGFRGWEGQDDDAQVSVARFGERVGEAEGSIANQAERIDSLEVRITSVESTIAQQSAEATATDINVRKLRRQVKKWSGDLDQLRESGTQEVQKAIATAQEAELTVGREVEKAKRETQETTKQIISTEVSRAVNKLRDELLSTISRAAQVSTPMGERSEGQVGADAMAQVLNKIRQVEVRLEVLASTTKEVRKQVTALD